ncbi:hypothetical protein [Solidesulfovibrio sp.]|uniref:Ig-like domain-containing protein n=1 Tax=Solidesulfovibrio sp. TaxID=2910990 RepID=UPI00262DA93F|nr:hypothetical protein [Solidesulfovibrio sp.]
MARRNRFYRCENEFGDDPCLLARDNRKIPEEDVVASMDGGNPKCPGQTVSGKPCGQKLVVIETPGGLLPPRRWLLAGVGAALLAVLVSFLLAGTGGTPRLQLARTTLAFPPAKGGVATATLTVRNVGDGRLVIADCEARPAEFSVPGQPLVVEPGEQASLTVRFQSASPAMREGTLLLRSNAQDPAPPVQLVANLDPWWVYGKVEAGSSTLTKEQ